VSSSSSDDESSSENENKTGEDIGILDEAWNDEDESLGNSLEDDLTDRMKDPDWNANMEDEETDSSDDDELDEEEVRENTPQDVRYVFIPVLPHCIKLYLLMKDSRNLEKY
jgi:hypothetical protein